MKPLGLLLLVTSLNLSIPSFGQTNDKKLTGEDEHAVLLVNHLSVVKISLSLGLNSEISTEDRNVYLSMCSTYIEYARNVYDANFREKLGTDQNETFDSIVESYEKLITIGTSGNREEVLSMMLFKKLTEIQVDRLLMRIMCG